MNTERRAQLAEAIASALLDDGPVAELANDRDRLAAGLHTARNQATAAVLELGELERDHQALHDAARAVVLWHLGHPGAAATLGQRLADLLDHLDDASQRADVRHAAELADIPDQELPGMWERADFTGGKFG